MTKMQIREIKYYGRKTDGREYRAIAFLSTASDDAVTMLGATSNRDSTRAFDTVNNDESENSEYFEEMREIADEIRPWRRAVAL